METKNEIVEFLEKELAEAEEMLEKYNYTDDEKATQYLIMANQLNYILEEIEEPAVEEPVAKVLVNNPNDEKPQKRGLSIFVNIYSFIIFMVSGVALNVLLTRAIELFVEFKGLPYAIFNLVFLCVHIFAFMTLLQNGHLAITNKK